MKDEKGYIEMVVCDTKYKKDQPMKLNSDVCLVGGVVPLFFVHCFFPLPSTFLTFAEAHICLGIVVHEFEEKDQNSYSGNRESRSEFIYWKSRIIDWSPIVYKLVEKSWNYGTEFAPILEQGGAISSVAEALV
ncbi:hypothetical protein P8452_41692 [Trifolium repens]|nr:hypothetical protein P8452_41692 [Trifolium repens]